MNTDVKRFVVVDDEESVRAIMARILGKSFSEAEVNIAGNPDTACIVIEEMVRCDKRPDLVFTDFHMSPHGNGLPVLRLCKEHGIPAVLVCSDDQRTDDFRSARELAGENFIAKPAAAPDIKAMAERILGLKS